MRVAILILLSLLLSTCSGDENGNDVPPDSEELELIFIFIGDQSLSPSSENADIPLDKPIKIKFSLAVDIQSAVENVSLKKGADEVNLSIEFKDDDRLLIITPEQIFESTNYTLNITDLLVGLNGEEFDGIQATFTTLKKPLIIEEVLIDQSRINPNVTEQDISRMPVIELHFNIPVDVSIVEPKASYYSNDIAVNYELIQKEESIIQATVSSELPGYSSIDFVVSSNLGNDVERPFDGLDLSFYTKLDSTVKFPELSDDDLLTKIQEQTFKYFWDFGHPVSGLARERNTSGQTVTSGGSGFGLMSIIVAVERGFITRQEGVDRLDKIVTFLGDDAQRFHGVWSHWLNGTTGQAIPFSTDDDGGDLVETAFMIQGLLTVRQYLDNINSQESDLIDKINSLWEDVEWDWYTQGGQNVLYWHWSPNFEWQKNLKITGWNESLIIYVLAASSPTHAIDASVYTEGWSRNGAMVNSNRNSFYGHTMDLRYDRGGPLFYSHYSFLGLDPRNLSDQFANYWSQNVNHSRINRDYCVQNPRNYVGYSTSCWGLTASDNHTGYSAHSPENDKGVITPTAAISALPYTPEESMEAIRHFYYLMGDKLWGEYGFYDAFNITENWYASSYLAIDQGPIICMIENHRTGLLWDLFMSAPEVQAGLTKLGFTY